eukprot:UN29298
MKKESLEMDLETQELHYEHFLFRKKDFQSEKMCTEREIDNIQEEVEKINTFISDYVTNPYGFSFREFQMSQSVSMSRTSVSLSGSISRFGELDQNLDNRLKSPNSANSFGDPSSAIITPCSPMNKLKRGVMSHQSTMST